MPRLSRRLLVAAAALTSTVAFGFLVAGLLQRGSRSGLRLTVTDAAGTVVLERIWPDADLRALAPLLPERRPLRARLVGLWHVAEPGRVRLSLHSESAARVALDGHVVVEREAGAKAAGREVEVHLPGGPRALELHADLDTAATGVRLRVARGDQDWRGLDSFDLYPEAVDMMGAGRREAARWLRRGSVAGLALAAGLVLLAALRARRASGAWPGWVATRALPLALFALAALLRLQAMVGRQWHADAPAWAREVVAAVGAALPGVATFAPEPQPWVGDPFSYLLAAREPERGFFSGHVREPLFVFLVRLMLWIVGGQDAAVQLASLLASALIPAALPFLGRALGSTAAGALAGLLFAFERQAIALSVEGWRDDLFVLLAVVFVTAVVRAWPGAGLWSGGALGLLGGLAALTRITSLSFVAPALLLLAVRRKTRRAAGVAAATCVVLLAPYLFNCWRTLGDPLVPINSHTGYYRGGVGLGAGSMSASQFLAAARPPWEALDVALYGLFVNPFERQWGGFDWLPLDAGPLLAWLAALGVLGLLGAPRGRALVALAQCAVAPFAFTWDLPGGGEWRFTLVAYPFLLVAAGWAAVLLWPGSGLARAKAAAEWTRRSALVAAVIVLALGASLLALPWTRAEEALRLGRATTVQSGPRDLFFTAFGGWSLPRAQGSIPVRSCEAACRLRVPGTGEALRLRLRAAPAGEAPARLVAILDGVEVARFELLAGGQRMAEVVLELPAAGSGRSCRLELRADAPFVVWYWTLREAEPA